MSQKFRYLEQGWKWIEELLFRAVGLRVVVHISLAQHDVSRFTKKTHMVCGYARHWILIGELHDKLSFAL